MQVKALAMEMADCAVELPTLSRSASFAETLPLTPQGSSLVRMTAVRSRAQEKLEQGGASMPETDRPTRMSATTCRSTFGAVRSP